MTKHLKSQIGAALTALCLAGAATPAAAEDALTVRAVNAISLAIASQGDAALEQIRAELKDTLLDRVTPYLPKPEAKADPKSARADAPKG